MAAHSATIHNALGVSTVDLPILWSSFASGANNVVFNVNGKDASKLLILVAGMSTLPLRVFVGTSDSRSSGGKMRDGLPYAFHYPYSAGKLGRMLIKSSAAADGNKRSRWRSTVAADSEVWAIWAIGPLETARFKDSDGYINVCRGITTVGQASHSSDTFYIAGIMIP